MTTPSQHVFSSNNSTGLSSGSALTQGTGATASTAVNNRYARLRRTEGESELVTSKSRQHSKKFNCTPGKIVFQKKKRVKKTDKLEVALGPNAPLVCVF